MESKSKPTHKCDDCGSNVTSKFQLEVHRRIHSGERPYQCSACFKRFSQLSNLRVHMRIHSGERPYKCSACRKCFRMKAALKCHVNTHTKEKPHICPICSRGYPTENNMKAHIRKYHPRLTPHKCNFCHKCFGNTSDRNNHVRTHLGKNPRDHPYQQFVCKTSGQEYLEEHERSHHSREYCNYTTCSTSSHTNTSLTVNEQKIHIALPTKPEPVYKKYPNKFYPTKDSEATHNQTQGEQKLYKCNFCSKTFSWPSHLQTHIRSHTNEKPFQCPLCPRSFKYKASQSIHLRVHTGERPYGCKICGRDFRQPSNLKQHLKAHADVSPRIVPCKVCQYACFTHKELCLHYSLCHDLPKISLRNLLVRLM